MRSSELYSVQAVKTEAGSGNQAGNDTAIKVYYKETVSKASAGET